MKTKIVMYYRLIQLKQFLIILSCLMSVACSNDSKEDIYQQYTKVCDIVAENYANFMKTKQTSGEIVLLYGALEKDINKSIPSEQVRISFFGLFNHGSGNRYELFKQEIKKMTKIEPRPD